MISGLMCFHMYVPQIRKYLSPHSNQDKQVLFDMQHTQTINRVFTLCMHIMCVHFLHRHASTCVPCHRLTLM